MQLRHGDLLLERIGDAPDGGPEIPDRASLVLAIGEATGHAHRVSHAYRVDDDTIAVRELGLLTHEEHRTLEVPPGLWRIVRQREWIAPRIQRRVID